MINKILVSACLMGFKVRYNGSEKSRMNEQLARWQQEERLVIHCPELAAGLAVPRPPAEIISADGKDVMHRQARIIENTGLDVTEQYQLAAWLALRTALESGCSAALLTDGSPTCGSQVIYDGSFSGIRKTGMGVAASLLAEYGIAVFSEEQIAELIAWIEEREGKK
ncbi:2-thiouracil desulfurase family protein [Enterobacter pasteurii]